MINQLERHQLGVSDTQLERLIARQQVQLDRRIALYRRGKPLIDLVGRTVILIDDGMATGSTAAAAVITLRAMNTGRIVVAVPTASEEIKLMKNSIAYSHIRSKASTLLRSPS